MTGNAGQDWWEAMRRNDHAAAWRVSDAVLAARDPATRDDPGQPYHLRWVWDGRRLDGADVLVRCYHGLGDTLQFSRYLPLLAGRARRVTLETQASLVPLLREVPGIDRIIAFDPAAPAPPGEVDVEIMELAHALRVLPPPCPALAQAPPRRIPGALPRIGLCWEAGGWDRARSVPLQALLAALPGARLVSLQRGPAACQAGAAFENPGDASESLAHTIALIAGCDSVISVDTMVAHLALTLGRSATVLLRHDADWRWGSAARTPWYPTARLLRQETEGDWRAPLRALAEYVQA